MVSAEKLTLNPLLRHLWLYSLICVQVMVSAEKRERAGTTPKVSLYSWQAAELQSDRFAESENERHCRQVLLLDKLPNPVAKPVSKRV